MSDDTDLDHEAFTACIALADVVRRFLVRKDIARILTAMEDGIFDGGDLVAEMRTRSQEAQAARSARMTKAREVQP